MAIAKVENKSRAISFQAVQEVQPDRYYYLTNAFKGVEQFFSARVSELYTTLVTAFSLDSMDWSGFKKYVWPTISSGAALLVGDYFSKKLSEYETGSSEYDFVFKFLFGTAVLGYCALNRITEKQYASLPGLSVAVASEVMAITYMYSSVYKGTTYLLSDNVSEHYSLVAGLGASTILVPSGISFLVQKAQELLVRRQYSQGAQRSDTAVISSGLTSVSNLYFQGNYFITRELIIASRLFQLGLIAHNMHYANQVIQQFRNLPALLADLAPVTIQELRAQYAKLNHDYEYNHKLHRVLRVTAMGAYFTSVPRYQLRTGDLVYCDATIDLACVPVSGELVALKRNEYGHFTTTVIPQKFSVNLKAQNGENVWIEHNTKPDFASPYSHIELHAIRDGKQAGVLVGDQLNVYGSNAIFIQIKPEKELLLNSNYVKKSVIDELIAERKQKSVLYSILGSGITAVFLQRDIKRMPEEMLNLMFTLFQTLIPFSESFMRETVNNRLIKKLNKHLGNQPFETIDALRVVDLCNALAGYYRDRFKGVTIISDKTGTLTTTQMNILGLWTVDMEPNVQAVLKDKEELLLPNESQWLDTFKVFCSAFTNNTKELEPEEYAILELFKSLLNEHCLEVTVHGTDHFKKTIRLKESCNEIETFHLGLYRAFGGRFTLVNEGGTYNLTFCGVPKADTFKDSPLFNAYSRMNGRTAVLSRDWCLAQCPLSEEEFKTLHDLFGTENKQAIERFILDHPTLRQNFVYYGTFIIDNPVKKGAEHFIGQCRKVAVPVLVATGDTTKAAVNIAKVLCPEFAEQITVLHAKESGLYLNETTYPAHSTIIFSGINEALLALFQQLMNREPKQRPVMIFAEMSTEGKGILARYLKKNRYFVVANGDGTNDVMMMKSAHMVIGHQAEDGSFAPGVGALVNISEEQLRRLRGSSKTFYELFDVSDIRRSSFMQLFAELANSQEKSLMALALKSGKMSFDLAKIMGANVREMHQQHWYSVAFDLTWLWISLYAINHSTDLPMDNRHINASSLINTTMALSLIVGILQAVVNYSLFNESTNITSLLLILISLPFILNSVFSGFKHVQENLYPIGVTEDRETRRHRTPLGYIGGFFAHRNAAPQIVDASQDDKAIISLPALKGT